MAKFKAGEMITGNLVMSDGSEMLCCFLVNRVINGNMYSVDDGNGFSDGRVMATEVDNTFTVC